MEHWIFKQLVHPIVSGLFCLFVCACSGGDTKDVSEVENASLSNMPSCAYLTENYPRHAFGKKLEINEKLSSEYVNWDSLTIRDYSFEKFFEIFGRPDFKLLMCPLDEYNQTNVDWEEPPSQSAPPVVQKLFGKNPGIRCIEFDWDFIANTNYKFSLYVIQCSDGLYPLYGELTSISARKKYNNTVDKKIIQSSLSLKDSLAYKSWKIDGLSFDDALKRFGNNPSVNKIDFEHCIVNEKDTIWPFYNHYLKYPYKDFYIASWSNIDEQGRTLILYLESYIYDPDNIKRVFWGYLDKNQE